MGSKNRNDLFLGAEFLPEVADVVARERERCRPILPTAAPASGIAVAAVPAECK